jgi:hypothetical protein
VCRAHLATEPPARELVLGFETVVSLLEAVPAPRTVQELLAIVNEGFVPEFGRVGAPLRVGCGERRPSSRAMLGP